jgi:mannosyltransferase OCH1-like enzyme
MANCVYKLINYNPEFDYYLYSEDECELFIKNNFDLNTYNAFMSINSVYGAMKADFFRYCILYKKGGIYLDIKSRINYPLDTLIEDEDDCLLDILKSDLEPWRKNNPTYEQWLLIFSPNHPYLLEVINTMVNNIINKYEPFIENIPILNSKQKILHITGPDMFSKCIHNYLKNNISLHRTIDYDKYFLYAPKSYINMYTINNKLHYSEYDEPLFI